MMYCIMIKDVVPTRNADATPLAVDIPAPALAGRLVERIAASYPGNGTDAASRKRWFRDWNGVHEIWVEPCVR